IGLRPGLSHLRSTRRRTPLLAASIQLASPARRDKIANAHQPPRPFRGQPVEAPHLGHLPALQAHGRSFVAGRRAPSDFRLPSPATAERALEETEPLGEAASG